MCNSTSSLRPVLGTDIEGRPVPRIASSWKQVSLTRYAYTIRSGVRFSDGTPMTTEGAAYSLRRHLDPAVASAYGFALGSLKAVRAHTVAVTLSKPDPTFPAVAAVGWQVVKKSFARAHPSDLGSPGIGTVATGPYGAVSFSSVKNLTLHRNPHYWGPGRKPTAWSSRRWRTPTPFDSAMRSGEIDGTIEAPLDDVVRWRKAKNVRTFLTESISVKYLSFDTGQKPFGNVYLRRALSYALDREQYARSLMHDGAEPAAVMQMPNQVKAVYSKDTAPDSAMVGVRGHINRASQAPTVDPTPFPALGRGADDTY
ncbi:ABC transporter substrate-binding protein [Streptomyces sp. NPDC087844]|uniref:ABC transporter substrate-binding protein n=1 Tax=Streptomyces sp. NPDC087844 TaxID=3365805 RepID=UPI003819CF2D